MGSTIIATTFRFRVNVFLILVRYCVFFLVFFCLNLFSGYFNFGNGYDG